MFRVIGARSGKTKLPGNAGRYPIDNHPTRLKTPKTGTHKVTTTVFITVLMIVTTSGLTSEANVLAAVRILVLQKLDTPRSTRLSVLALLLMVTTRMITVGKIGRPIRGLVSDLFCCIDILILPIVSVTMMPLAALVMTLSVRKTGIFVRTTALRPWANCESVTPRNRSLNIGVPSPTGLSIPCMCVRPPHPFYRIVRLTTVRTTNGREPPSNLDSTIRTRAGNGSAFLRSLNRFVKIGMTNKSTFISESKVKVNMMSGQATVDPTAECSPILVLKPLVNRFSIRLRKFLALLVPATPTTTGGKIPGRRVNVRDSEDFRLTDSCIEEKILFSVPPLARLSRTDKVCNSDRLEPTTAVNRCVETVRLPSPICRFTFGTPTLAPSLEPVPATVTGVQFTFPSPAVMIDGDLVLTCLWTIPLEWL